MADHRKASAPPPFLGRLRARRSSVLCSRFGFVPGSAPEDAADSNERRRRLDGGQIRQRRSAADRHDQFRQRLAPADAAKALYLRGIAYRKLGQPPRAIADLGAAIWLGLPDRATASRRMVNRGPRLPGRRSLERKAMPRSHSARKAGGSGEVDQLIAEGGGTPARRGSIAAFSTEVTREAQAARRRRAADPHGRCLGPMDHDRGCRRRDRQREQRQPREPLVRLADRLVLRRTSGASTPASRPRRAWWGADQAATPSPPVRRAQHRLERATKRASRTRERSRAWHRLGPRRRGETLVASDATRARAAAAGSPGPRSRQPPPPPASRDRRRGGYRLQLTTSRSEDEAKALWKQVSSQNTAACRQRAAGSRRSISAISAPSIACRSDPSRTRRKALSSATR